MASDETNQNRRSVTLKVAEINSLRDRLRARALSILLRDQPEQARDLSLAAAVISTLLKNVHSSDVVEVSIEDGNEGK